MLPPRSYLFFGLNAVRAISIISLLLVFSSTVFVMATNIKAVNAFEAAKQNGANSMSTNSADGTNELNMLDCDYIEGSTVPNQPAGVFWAVVSSLLIIFQVVVLLLSELSWPAKFFDRFFPVLGTNFGLGALGIFQCLIGAQILSHHVDDFTLGAAMLLFSVGCLNILLGLIFRDKAKQNRSITAWRNEGKGVLPTANGSSSGPVFVNATPHLAPALFNGHPEDEKVPFPDYSSWRNAGNVAPPMGEKASLGFGRQGEKAAGLRGFILQRPIESLPRYAPPPPPSNPSPPTSSHGHSKRGSSVRSSTSSFASPSQPQSPTLSYTDSRPSTPTDQHAAPTFKSSPTAL